MENLQRFGSAAPLNLRVAKSMKACFGSEHPGFNPCPTHNSLSTESQWFLVHEPPESRQLLPTAPEVQAQFWIGTGFQDLADLRGPPTDATAP